jgi:hypothetical protein
MKSSFKVFLGTLAFATIAGVLISLLPIQNAHAAMGQGCYNVHVQNQCARCGACLTECEGGVALNCTSAPAYCFAQQIDQCVDSFKVCAANCTAP